MNNFKMQQVLEFQILFPDERPLSPIEYMKGGGRNVILKSALFLLSLKPDSSRENDNQIFLEKFFSSENKNFSSFVADRIQSLEREGMFVHINNPLTSLKLFECFFSKDEEDTIQSDVDFEINLLKAYLVLNSEFARVQQKAFTSTESLESEFHLSMMLFCAEYPASDKINFDIKQIWATQMIKSVYLFNFLESNKTTKRLLDAFLVHFDKLDWQEYLKGLLQLSSPEVLGTKKGQIDIVIEPDANFEKNCAFVEKLVIQDVDIIDEYDYKTLRSKPFFKIKDGIYRIIFNLFVVEKIYKGAYFFLNSINDGLPKADRISEFRGFYGFEFSEKVLAYKVLDSIFVKSKIRFNGQELNAQKIQSEPDYYVHNGNNIFLFESKDFLIKASKKESFDYNIYCEEFKRILYFEEKPDKKIKNKAILQIISNIKRILMNDFIADRDYYYKDVFIYPILLVHDHQYETLGFNTLLNNWFQLELTKLESEGFYIHHVKPLTVINIDSLIYHQAALVEDFSLNIIIDSYHDFIQSVKLDSSFFSYHNQSLMMSKNMPFGYFIEDFFRKKKIWKIPHLFESIKELLFIKN